MQSIAHFRSFLTLFTFIAYEYPFTIFPTCEKHSIDVLVSWSPCI
jgi:hypothetical protein